MHSLAVVIPCYNVEKYLRTAVESVLSQTYPVDEIILVDNNSSDGTYALMESLAQLSPKVRLMVQHQKGAPAARNMGWKASNSEFIHFLDADDYLLPESLMKKMKVLIDEGPEFLVNGHIRLSEKGERYDFVAEKDLFKGLFNGRLGGSSSNIIHRSLLEKVGGWNEVLSSSQEMTLFFEILKLKPKTTVVEESLSVILEREGQISKSDPVPRWKLLIALRSEILSWLQSNESNYFESNREYYLQSFFDWLHVAYAYIPEIALAEYDKWIKGNGFNPRPSKAVSANFLRMYKAIGFRNAESLRLKLRRS
ncbi:MAG: glycosyltransferase family 2 protein [Flavobacteriales bacterium]|jgi:glycosyltransferase involved in cell wall biosynthesis